MESKPQRVYIAVIHRPAGTTMRSLSDGKPNPISAYFDDRKIGASCVTVNFHVTKIGALGLATIPLDDDYDNDPSQRYLVESSFQCLRDPRSSFFLQCGALIVMTPRNAL